MNNRRGLSLIEVMVTVGLVSVALLLVSALFQFGVKINRSAEERNALQGDRLRLSRKLQRTLANSYRSGNTAFYLTDPGPQEDLVISIITPGSWDAANQRALFDGYDIYYRSASDNTLRFLRHTIAPTHLAEPLSETEVRNAITANPGTTILKTVSNMQLFVPATGTTSELLTNPVAIRLVQQTTRGTNLTTELTFKFVSP